MSRMSFQSPVRSRFGGSKVRSGCLTCKARHVKCDETKPSCHRCDRAHRQCEGYVQPKQHGERSPERTLVIINYVAPSSSQMMPRLLPAAAVDSDIRELRSLDYFRARTVPELAGSFNSEFWSRFILQTAQHEPAIRHAIIGLGSLHEHFEGAEDALTAQPDFGLQQYGKAIHCVLQGPAPLAGQSADVALISCILFTAFESLQGHYRSALTHINSGLKVLAECEAYGDVHGTYIPKELLKSLFIRFDTQALEIGDIAFRPRPEAGQDSELQMPSVFSTLEEAEHVFDQYFNALIHFLQAVQDIDKEGVRGPDQILRTLGVQRAKRVDEYQNWCNAFDNYLALDLTNPVSPTSLPLGQPRPGVLILQVWRIVVRIMLHVDLSAGELSFDGFIEDSRNLVELAESFVQQTAAPARTQKAPKGIKLTKFTHQSPPISTIVPLSQDATYRTSMSASHGFLGMQPIAPLYMPVDASSSPATSSPSGATDSCSSPSSTDSGGSSTKGLSSSRTSTPLSPKPPTVLKPTFSLSLGLVAPLYITVTRCRDPTIRRRALHLLYSCNRREGIWDSRLAARVAQRIVEVEEAGAVPLPGYPSSDGTDTVVVISADQIPEHARVRELETSFLPDRKAGIRYTKSIAGGHSSSDPPEYYEELLQW